MNRTSSKIVFLAGVSLFLAGCGHGHGDHAQSGPATSHESHGSELQLALNDGKKWQVDEPTRESATKIAQLVDEAETLHSVADARALGKALDEELDTLVQNCKMTGPAHDQLHVFLVALFPEVEALKEKTNVEGLQRARSEIGSLLEAYETHFESGARKAK